MVDKCSIFPLSLLIYWTGWFSLWFVKGEGSCGSCARDAPRFGSQGLGIPKSWRSIKCQRILVGQWPQMDGRVANYKAPTKNRRSDLHVWRLRWILFFFFVVQGVSLLATFRVAFNRWKRCKAPSSRRMKPSAPPRATAYCLPLMDQLGNVSPSARRRET